MKSLNDGRRFRYSLTVLRAIAPYSELSMPMSVVDSCNSSAAVLIAEPDEERAAPRSGAESSRQKLWHWLLPVGYSATLVLSAITRPVFQFDDAIPLVNAVLVQRGLTPHVGFFSLYPPLTYYLNAALFFIFGQTVLAQRLFFVSVYALFLAFLAMAIRKRFRCAKQSHGVLMTLVVAAIGHLFMEPVWYAFAVSLMILMMYSRVTQRDDRLRPVFVTMLGLGNAFVILCRINIGCYLLLSVVTHTLVKAAEPSRTRDTADHNRAHRMRGLVAYGGGLVLGLGAFGLSYGRSIQAVISQSIVVMVQLLGSHRFVPLSFGDLQSEALLILPIAWFGFRLAQQTNAKAAIRWVAVGASATGYMLILKEFANSPHVLPKLWVLPVFVTLVFHFRLKRLEPTELALLLFYCISLHYPLSVPDQYHFLALLPIVVALLPYIMLFDASQVPHKGKQIAAWTMFLFVLVIISFPNAIPSASQMNSAAELIGSGHVLDGTSDSDRLLRSTDLPRGWDTLYGNADEWAALRFVYQRTNSDAPVFIGLKRHSEVHISDVRAYWLLGRRIGVWRHVLEPGMTTEADIQAEMAGDLQKNRVNWVILVENFVPKSAVVPAPYRGSSLLDKYLAAKYRTVFRSGAYYVLQARQPL